MDKVNYACIDCGHAALKHSRIEPKNQEVTFHEAQCDVCDKLTSVTNIRNWGYSVINKYQEYIEGLKND